MSEVRRRGEVGEGVVSGGGCLGDDVPGRTPCPMGEGALTGGGVSPCLG